MWATLLEHIESDDLKKKITLFCKKQNTAEDSVVKQTNLVAKIKDKGSKPSAFTNSEWNTT
jgi:hypothetical protein